MKKLKSLVAIGVAMSAMHFAKAENVEKVFEPTVRDGAEIDRIELVNGQILVRAPKAEIEGVKTPFVYVSTNTENFASNAFAQGGLTNVNNYVHAGNGKIYMTETNTNALYTTQVSNSPALNGVKTGVTKVEDFTGIDTSLLDVMKKSIAAGFVTKMFDGELYRIENKENGTRRGAFKYVGEDNAAYGWKAANSSTTIPGTFVDLIDVVKDAENHVTCYTLVKKEDGSMQVYAGKKPVNANTQESSNGLPSDAKSVIVTGDVAKGNGMIYYATAKKLGYIRQRQD